MELQFGSDNRAIADPEVMQALAACNSGSTSAYGTDSFTQAAVRKLTEVFERPVFVFPVPTGTAANGLALGAVTPPYGAVLCHKNAHIVTTECGAPEFYSGGARLCLLEGKHNKLTAGQVERELAELGDGTVHHLVPKALSLTQATECGTLYTPGEIDQLSRVAHDRRMKVHMDGARFANALAALECSAAELSWRSGVDILSFGTTKNGTLNAEAVIAFDEDLALEISYRHKRAGHLNSKMRFSTVQLSAYLTADRWLENARYANRAAKRLHDALVTVPGVELVHPVQANILFARLPAILVRELEAFGIELRCWPGGEPALYRLVTSFCEQEEGLHKFETACARTANTLS